MVAQQIHPNIQCPADAADLYTIWPGNGVPPGSEAWTWQERTIEMPGSGHMARNVVIPTLTLFRPAAGTANGTALIIAPGGAFHFLMMDYEGYDVARWLAGCGITAFVLKYRLARTPDEDAAMSAFCEELQRTLIPPERTEVKPPVGIPTIEAARCWAEEDGRQAIRFVRARANEWDVDPKRIGIMGFSAGGGVAVDAARESDEHSRPDFVGGIYAVYRPEMPVPRNAPPLFLAITSDDALVSPISSARLYEAWHRASASAELHIFSDGGHGFGMQNRKLHSDVWTILFERWLTARGLLSPAST